MNRSPLSFATSSPRRTPTSRSSVVTFSTKPAQSAFGRFIHLHGSEGNIHAVVAFDLGYQSPEDRLEQEPTEARVLVWREGAVTNDEGEESDAVLAVDEVCLSPLLRPPPPLQMTLNASKLARLQDSGTELLDFESFVERSTHHGEDIQPTTGNSKASFQVENVDYDDDDFRLTLYEVSEEPTQISPIATPSTEIVTKPNTSTKIQHAVANESTSMKRARAQSEVYPHHQLMESLRFVLPDGKVNGISAYPGIRPVLEDVLSSLCSSKGTSVGAYLLLADRSNCLFSLTRHESSNFDKGYAFGCRNCAGTRRVCIVRVDGKTRVFPRIQDVETDSNTESFWITPLTKKKRRNEYDFLH